MTQREGRNAGRVQEKRTGRQRIGRREQRTRYEQGGRECGRERARRGVWVELERSCRKGGRRV